MRITREVIYDLLPAYFANEVSTDTRTLIDDFFADDPEFGRMAARFRTLLSEQQRQTEPETDAARERAAFDRARAAAELPIKARAAALAWALASLFSGVIAFLTWNDRMGFVNPGLVIGVCFALGAALTFAVSFFVTPDSPWRALVGLDDETLRTVGWRGDRRDAHH